jgi:effector-binding domain-containing protein
MLRPTSPHQKQHNRVLESGQLQAVDTSGDWTLRMMGLMLWKAVVFLLLFPVVAAAGISRQDSFVIPSSDGTKLLVMICPDSQHDEGSIATLPDGREFDVRENFEKSGCYDAKTLAPLWQVDWYAPQSSIRWSKDFSHVARIDIHRDARWEGYLEFWRDGKLIKHYKGSDLLTGLRQEEFLCGYWDWPAWCDGAALSADQQRLYVKTTRRSLWLASRKIDLRLQEFYTFDLSDGSINSRRTTGAWLLWAYGAAILGALLLALLSFRILLGLRVGFSTKTGFDVVTKKQPASSDAAAISICHFHTLDRVRSKRIIAILMPYEIRIEQFPGKPLAVVRRQASMQQLGPVIQQACGLVWNTLRSQNVKGAGRHVSVYLDSVFNLEVGVELEAPFTGAGEVIGSSLPAGPVATITHFGPYQRLSDAHEAIHQWCKANGREPIRPCWEIYGHWLNEWNADPGKIRTDVYYLLTPGQ